MGAEVTRGQQEQEATMTLRAGGTMGGAVTRNQVPRLWGRSWNHVGKSVALKRCLKAGQERERYPGFSLFLFCYLPLCPLLADPMRDLLAKEAWKHPMQEGWKEI